MFDWLYFEAEGGSSATGTTGQLPSGTLVVDPTDPSRLYAGRGGNGVFRFGLPP